jgi:hypothetical protein
MTTKSRLQCLRFTLNRESVFGRRNRDDDSENFIEYLIETGTFKADPEIIRVNSTTKWDVAGPTDSQVESTRIIGQFNAVCIPQMIKHVMNLGLQRVDNLAGAESTAELPSWEADYITLSEDGDNQAVRFLGFLASNSIVSASKEDPVERVQVQFIAREVSDLHFLAPHPQTFDFTGWTTNPYLFKNAYLTARVGDRDIDIDIEGFRITMNTPIVTSAPDEEGKFSGYGAESSEVTVEITVEHNRATYDMVKDWLGSPATEFELRIMFLHPQSTRYQVIRPIPQGAGLIQMSPEFLASPVALKSDRSVIQDQDILMIEGVERSSPGSPVRRECVKCFEPIFTSPTGLHFEHEPTDHEVKRWQGMRFGYETGAFVYSMAHEIVLPRLVFQGPVSFDSGGTAKKHLAFIALADPVYGTIIDSFNNALNSGVR